MTFLLGKQIHGTAHVGVMDYIYVLFRDKERSTGLSVEAIGNIARKGCRVCMLTKTARRCGRATMKDTPTKIIVKTFEK